ncbi:MAG: hypothetical protein IJX76_08775 [Clostridia bacterium]|nr:hypothetical protein [Clostridia bacterium]
MTEIVLTLAVGGAAGLAVGIAVGLWIGRIRRRRQRLSSTADSFLKLLRH